MGRLMYDHKPDKLWNIVNFHVGQPKYKWPTSSSKMMLMPEQTEWSGLKFLAKMFFAVEFVRCAIIMHLCLNMQLTLGT